MYPLTQDMTKRRAEPFHTTAEVRRMEATAHLTQAKGLLSRIMRAIVGDSPRNLGDLVTDNYVFSAKRRRDI